MPIDRTGGQNNFVSEGAPTKMPAAQCGSSSAPRRTFAACAGLKQLGRFSSNSSNQCGCSTGRANRSHAQRFGT
eukprot:363938-Chlamydomonas_euryale.AAC.8